MPLQDAPLHRFGAAASYSVIISSCAMLLPWHFSMEWLNCHGPPMLNCITIKQDSDWACAVYRWLSLHYCKAISDKGLMHLAALSALVHLDIGFCEKLTDRYTPPLGGCSLLHPNYMAALHDLQCAAACK